MPVRIAATASQSMSDRTAVLADLVLDLYVEGEAMDVQIRIKERLI